MSFDQNKTTDAGKDGIGIRDDDGILKVVWSAGDNSPVGSQAPVGSEYIQSDGVKWIKFGSGTNDWEPVSKNAGVLLSNDLSLIFSNDAGQVIG